MQLKIDKLIDFDNLKYNWDEIENIPEFSILKDCEQSPKWHSEGNVWNHTRMVCDAMISIIKSDSMLTSNEVKILLTSALFHDIGKGTTTIFRKEAWHAYGHEMDGEKITRKLLWNEDVLFRETVCSLVRWHMEPLRVVTDKHPYEKTIHLSRLCNGIRLLCILKLADSRGSIQAIPSQDDENKLTYLINTAIALNCYESAPKIPTFIDINNPHTDVFVLIGLPGAGKDTFISQQMTAWDDKNYFTIISRDDIRADLGFCERGFKMIGTPEQEKLVTEEFNRRLVEAANQKKTIILNNMNNRRLYRDDYKKLVPNACWNYIYIEAPSLECNKSRRCGQINPDSFEMMIDKFDWPVYDEYDSLGIFVSDCGQFKRV